MPTPLDGTPPAAPTPPTPPEGPRTGSRRVLLAEDDDQLRCLLASVLREDGHEVIEAGDGLELLATMESLLADAHASRNLVIVADVNMPGLTGLDVLAIIRCAHLKIPFCIITAFADPETRAEAFDLSAAAVLDKPVDIDVLRSAVVEAGAR
jgi:CheY-like chemotaxis protein